MSYIDRAVMDLIARGQSSRLVPTSGKIFDLTHPDVNEHSVDLPAGFPSNTKAIMIYLHRISGTGNLRILTHSGANPEKWIVTHTSAAIWVRAIDGKFYYFLSVANDDFDVYAQAYWAG